MKLASKLFVSSILSLMVFSAQAAEPTRISVQSNQFNQVRAAEARRFTVKVMNKTQHAFFGQNGPMQEGHGTGFILKMDNNEILLATNKHVIAKSPLFVQEVTLELSPVPGTRALLKAEVLHQGLLQDFAILRVDLKKQKAPKLLEQMREAPMIKADEAAVLLQQGRYMMAYGFPNDGNHISTFGSITGVTRELFGSESAIQTEAAINPGNSGGPLIDVETGKVIGINTAKLEDADSTGFAIPLLPVLADLHQIEVNPKFGQKISLDGLVLQKISESDVPLYQLQKEVGFLESLAPDFFARHEGILQIRAVEARTGLKPGDIIFSVGGAEVGDEVFRIHRKFAESRKLSIEVMAIRNDRLVQGRLRLKDLSAAIEAQGTDFLLVSGLVLQDNIPKAGEDADDDEMAVRVTAVLPYIDSRAKAFISVGAQITKAVIDGRSYALKSVKHFETLIHGLKPEQTLRVVVSNPMKDPETGGIVFDDGSLIYSAPLLVPLAIESILTAQQLRFKEFKENFDFQAEDPKRHFFSEWISHCQDALAAKKTRK